MRLSVSADNAKNGVMHYGILPVADSPQLKRDWERYKTLQPRIEAMAKRELGEEFVGVEFSSGVLFLKVKVGTSSRARKFALRSLLGWIELFDSEEHHTTSE